MTLTVTTTDARVEQARDGFVVTLKSEGPGLAVHYRLSRHLAVLLLGDLIDAIRRDQPVPDPV